MKDQRLSLLRLWAAKGIGSKRAKTILEISDYSPDKIFELGSEYFMEHSELSKPLIDALFSNECMDRASSIFEQICRYGIQMLVRGEAGYPSVLEHLDNPPLVLFADGMTTFPKKTIAIVGSRKPSAAALAATENFAHYLSQNQIGIISGFARGVDHAAHRAAIESGTKWTAAILGSGLRSIYPSEYSGFANELKKTGLLLSEFGLFDEAKPAYFPLRNRLIASLADATVVIEASEKSGSLITAECALKLGKDIFVLPFNPGHSSEGSNKLIKDGAHCVTQPIEILQAMRWDASAEERLPFDLNCPILSALERETVLSVEEIIEATGKDIKSVLSELGKLELKGIAVSYPGQKWSLKHKCTTLN